MTRMRTFFRWLLGKPASAGDKEAKLLVAVLEKCYAQLDKGKPVRALELSKEEWLNLKPFCLITAKPVLYAANVAEDGFENNPQLDAVRAHAAAEGAEVVAICASIEAEIVELDDEEKQMFLADLGLEEPGLDRLIHTAYHLLGLQTYLPLASRKCARGRSTRATPRRRPPG